MNRTHSAPISLLIPALLAVTFLLTSPLRAAIAIDASVSVNQNSAKTTVAAPALSTTSGNELLLAFVSADFISGTNTTVSSISGGGLTWTLAVRTNTQKGTAEIWQAFAASPLSGVTVTATLSHSVVSSMTVLSFTGVNTSSTVGATKSASASTGAPAGTLVTTQNNSWVFGVGDDWDNAIGRTVPAGQSLVHQYLSSTGDTYWVQMQNSPTPLSGTSVTINDTAPTGDRYNLSLIEILAATGGSGSTSTISGTLSPASLVSGTTITLMLPGGGTATTTPDGSGNYSFDNLGNGSYTVVPTKSGQTFNPSNLSMTVSGSNVPGVNFTMQTWSISGNVGTSATGTTVTLSGAVNASTTADGSGNFSFANLPNGSYTVTPTNSGFTFNPPNQPLTVSGGNVGGVTFTATAVPTWTISGTISPTNLGSGVLVVLSGSASATTNTDSNGNYSFANLSNGSYTVTPSHAGESFTPSSQPVVISGGSMGNENFNAQTSVAAALAIDASVSTDASSKLATVATPSFSTKSANELLLAFVSADYLTGENTTVTGITGGPLTWILVQRTNVQSGTAEIWRAFASTPLSGAVVTASLSQKVLSSLTVVSFIGADQTGTNGSGAIGALASTNADPGAPSATLVTTRNNSWVFGVSDDFDNAVSRTLGPNQTMVHQDLSTSGDTYWVQRETNVTPIIGTSITINDTAPKTDRYNLSVVEVLPSAGGPPPTVSLATPLPFASVTGIAAITANAASTGSSITGVQFELDGSNMGAQVTSSPYSYSWDTTKVAAGTHTLSAIAYNSVGLSAISSTITVTVDNSTNVLTAGSWSLPVTLPAVAVNLTLTKNNTVLFYQDGSTPTIWDYSNNLFTNVPAPVDLFCSGQTELADGRILIVGGYGQSGSQMGIANAEIFDPSTNTWNGLPSMVYSRWYPSATTLSDGRVIVLGGWQTTEHTNAGIPEIYDPVANTWTQLTAANNPFETYPFIYQLSSGQLIHVNGSEYATVTDMLNLSATKWSTVDPNIKDGGSSVMYLQDKIMKAGSASDSQETGPSANTTYVLDMTQPSPSWQQTASMAYARTFLNLTELPDGTVLATGGETDKNGGNINNAVYPAELWSPATETWTMMAAMHTPREYHGTALLLPDGRVLESGMGADFGNVPDQLSAEFYTPPYLFKGPRPTITQSPSQITYGQNFSISTPDAATIASAVLIRLGAVTHFFNMNARFVPVTFQQAAGGLTITAPANSILAPPGYYMLFILNSNGVPSVAPFMQLQQSQ